MNTPDLNWPQEGDKAFRDPKRKGPLHLTDAIITPSEDAYLNGFKRAADMVADASGAEGIDPSDLFYPAAYLYRHHVELFLKELVRLGVQLGTFEKCEVCGVLGSHDLHNLWKLVKRVALAANPEPAKDKGLAGADQLIQELHQLDSSGQAFRYAARKDGKPSLGGAPRVVNLANLKSRMDALSQFLEGTFANIDACDPGPL